jgi:hypothetical protein
MAQGEFLRQVRASSEEAHQYLGSDGRTRGHYRGAAVVVGLLLLAAGVIAFAVSGDVPWSGGPGHGLAGFSLNRAGGVLLVVLGVLVLVGALAPGNPGAAALTGTGVLMLLVGLLNLAVFRTGANVVAFSVVDVCGLWVLAMATLWCGMHTWDLEEHRTLLGDHPTEYREPTAHRTEDGEPSR